MIVERRVSLFVPFAVGVPLAAYIFVSIFPVARGSLADFFISGESLDGLFGFLLVAIPVLSVVNWFRFASGEVFRCSRNELLFARRQPFRYWQRFRFAAVEVKGLSRAIRSAGRSSYPVLSFAVRGRTYDILENMGYTDSDRVLRACKSLGLDVVIDETADAMLKDIEKRGWWINPFRTDDLGGPSDRSKE